MEDKGESISVYMEIEFPYKKEESEVFKMIRRPKIKIKVLSQVSGEWEVIDEVLADTGADFCVFPRFIGNLLVEDITKGRYIEIKGVVPGARLIAYLHELRVKIENKEFTAPIALADSDDVPCIFGRVEALDLFEASFLKGKRLKLKY